MMNILVLIDSINVFFKDITLAVSSVLFCDVSQLETCLDVDHWSSLQLADK
jgi:hypothetical protein